MLGEIRCPTPLSFDVLGGDGRSPVSTGWVVVVFWCVEWTLGCGWLFYFDGFEVDEVHGVAGEAGDVVLGEVHADVVEDGQNGGITDGEAVHLAVEGPTGSIGEIKALVVPFVEGIVAETGVVGWCGLVAVEDDEERFGIGVVGKPGSAEEECL